MAGFHSSLHDSHILKNCQELLGSGGQGPGISPTVKRVKNRKQPAHHGCSTLTTIGWPNRN